MKHFRVRLEVEARIDWMGPARSTEEKIARRQVESRAKRIAFGAEKSLRDVIESTLEDPR